MPVIGCDAPAQEFSEGCSFIHVPEDHVVTVRTGVVVMTIGDHFDKLYTDYGLHPHTVSEEARSIANRHLKKTPEPDVGSVLWRNLCDFLDLASAGIGYVPMTSFRTLVKDKPAGKKRRYREGWRIYVEDGLRENHSRIQEMQKLEFFEADKLAGKEDRCVQFRTVVFNAAIGRHLHGVEHLVYRYFVNPNGIPVIVKGMSPFLRAAVLKAHAAQFKDPVFILADHSRFDAHVNEQILKQEHRFYLRCRGYDPELAQLCKWQQSNIGFSAGGIVYRIRGKRMSGDYNTALGNSLLNVAMMTVVFRERGVVGHMMVDGDDSVIIIDRRNLGKLTGLASDFLSFGFVTEIEIAEEIEHAEFCQSRLVETTYGPVFVRNPRKYLSLIGQSVRNMPELTQVQWVAAKAMCDALMNPGVPVYTAVTRRVIDDSGVRIDEIEKFNFLSVDEQYKKSICNARFWTFDHVSDSARVSFERAWGMDTTEQDFWEHAPFHWGPGKGVRARSRLREHLEVADFDTVVTEAVIIDRSWILQLEPTDFTDSYGGEQYEEEAEEAT